MNSICKCNSIDSIECKQPHTRTRANARRLLSGRCSNSEPNHSRNNHLHNVLRCFVCSYVSAICIEAISMSAQLWIMTAQLFRKIFILPMFFFHRLYFHKLHNGVECNHCIYSTWRHIKSDFRSNSTFGAICSWNRFTFFSVHSGGFFFSWNYLCTSQITPCHCFSKIFTIKIHSWWP